MSNMFDAIAQVYEFLQVPEVSGLIDGRIYQHRFPTDGEVIGEGADKFIVINNIESQNGQLVKTIPVNIQVFCLEKDGNMMDVSSLNQIDKAIDAALDDKEGDGVTGYAGVEKIFSVVMPENPYSKKHTLMMIRINLIINTL